jgi:hypothetical protein
MSPSSKALNAHLWQNENRLVIKKRIFSLIKEINFTRIQGKTKNTKCQKN